jgi:telomerase reverse transcriptase
VWRYVAEPAMTALKVKMFEEIDLNDAYAILDSRQLGFSQVRLLPKGITVRPIMNLRKKMARRGNEKLLGQSINTILKPVHTVLQLEKVKPS